MINDKPTDEQIAKLPKWAQYYIMQLETTNLRMEQAEKLRDVDNANLQWQGPLDDKWHGLPEDSTIRLSCPEAQFDVSLRDGELLIYEFGRAQRLYAEPRAANHIVVTTEERIVARANNRRAS